LFSVYLKVVVRHVYCCLAKILKEKKSSTKAFAILNQAKALPIALFTPSDETFPDEVQIIVQAGEGLLLLIPAL